jgi:hypothetical protein
MKALNLANRQLLSAMARARRADAQHAAAMRDLAAARKQVALLIAAIGMP